MIQQQRTLLGRHDDDIGCSWWPSASSWDKAKSIAEPMVSFDSTAGREL
jgi:hypothetical protein